MPYVDLAHARIHYEEFGNGYPVLLLAPGGVRSETKLWRHARNGQPRPYPDPTAVLANDFRLIAMDQRNAGSSVGRIGPDDGWETYARDQLGLMDHLGINRFHVLGACIGGPFSLKLAQLAPDRVSAIVMQATIGLDEHNRHVFDESFDDWASEVRSRRPDVDPGHLDALKKRLFDSDFVFGVSREFVRALCLPLLVLEGDDEPHPSAVSREVCRLARNAVLVSNWKGDANRSDYTQTILAFLRRHTPEAGVRLDGPA